MKPIFFSYFVGAFIFAITLYLLNWANLKHCMYTGAIAMVFSCTIRFFLIRKEVLAEKLAKYSVRTPLSIVYINDRGELYKKKYLDLELLKRVWGYEVEGIFFSISNLKDDNPQRFALQDLKQIKDDNTERFTLVDLEQIEPTGVFSKPLSRLPSTYELMLIRKNRKKVEATIWMLNFYDVKADGWNKGHYLCLNVYADEDVDVEVTDKFFRGKITLHKDSVRTMDMTPDTFSPPEPASKYRPAAYVRLVSE